ncbi:MAG TPA: response regulator transcription factor [Paenirhodobacter sp.]
MKASNPCVLLVDDARDIRDSIGQYLRAQGLHVVLAAGAEPAREALQNDPVDLVVLDIMMPGEDGLSLCKWIAASGGPPVILLTARTDETDKIIGLELGADDFVTKPCNPRELLARIRSVLRRTGLHRERPLHRRRFADMLHDAQIKQIICADGRQIPLTSGENRLLSALLDHHGQAVSRADLMPIVTGREARAFERTIDNAVSRLRRKIEIDPTMPQLIITERSGGYRLAATVVDVP